MAGIDKALHDQYRAAFSIFDENDNGSISQTEFAEATRATGRNPSDKDIEAMFADADSDANGNICFDEFVALMEKNKQDPQAQNHELEASFRELDVDGSGAISKDEFRRVMTKMGQRMTDKDVDDFFDAVDTDHEGTISLAEYMAALGVSD